MTTSSSQATLDSGAKLREVTRLVDNLAAERQDTPGQESGRNCMLQELLIFSRQEGCSDPLFTEKGIATLSRYAFQSESQMTSRNALKVLANAMRWRPMARQFFVNMKLEAEASRRLGSGNCEDEFLLSRLLLLTTYETNIDLLNLIDQHSLSDVIVENLARHARRFSQPTASEAAADTMEIMALIETLKLLFSLTNKCPQRVSSFTPAILHILDIFANITTPASGPPLDPPTGLLINALMNLDLKDECFRSFLHSKNKADLVVHKFLHLLDISTRTFPGRQTDTPGKENTEKDRGLEATVTPLVNVMSRIYEDAPDNARRLIRARLLPSVQDRQKGIGKADTVTSRLLRISTHPATPELAKSIQRLYFDLSDRDANKFVDNVGYGYAIGFLMQNQICLPGSGTTGHTAVIHDGVSRPVNPITGQFVDAEGSPDMPEMTEEEKQREAERLFILFERLKTSGVIDVQNPVEQAFRSGRIEELPDGKDTESPT